MEPQIRPAITLEEALRTAIADGKEQEILPLLRCLPIGKREAYRLIWAEELKKRGITAQEEPGENG